MKRAIILFRTFMWCAVGAFLGSSIYQFVDYKLHPAEYMVQSAPWYTPVILYGIITAAVVIPCIIAILILKNKAK